MRASFSIKVLLHVASNLCCLAWRRSSLSVADPSPKVRKGQFLIDKNSKVQAISKILTHTSVLRDD